MMIEKRGLAAEIVCGVCDGNEGRPAPIGHHPADIASRSPEQDEAAATGRLAERTVAELVNAEGRDWQPMSGSRWERVSTDQLRPGDIVSNSIMYLLIDGDIRTFERDDRTVYATAARVINPQECQRDKFVSYHIRQDGGRWNLQGNNLAVWSRLAPPRAAI